MSQPQPDRDMLALGIQQPWAELILRGVKTVEVRSQDTKIRGRIYLYASRRLSDIPEARKAIRAHDLDVDSLPRGVLVGTVEIVASARCTTDDAAPAGIAGSYLKDRYGWHLRRPQAFDVPLEVRFLPYGVWFYPFKRRGSRRRP